MIIFETERLRVRQYNLSDEDSFFLLNGNEDVVRYIRPVKTREECNIFLKQVIQSYQASPITGRWAVQLKNDNSFVGSFAIIPVEGKDQMQLGYALLPENWGRGYATELTIGGIEYAFTKTGINPLFAYTDQANIASQKVLLKAGFNRNENIIEGGKELAGFICFNRQRPD